MDMLNSIKGKKISPEQIFMLSGLLVNGGNYLYNLILGRVLGPEKFADAAVLITFLLVVSFVAMSFQLVTAKFSYSWSEEEYLIFTKKIFGVAILVGLFFGGIIVAFSKTLQTFLNTTSSQMFVYFGIGVPFYFLMSVNRGVFQGKKQFVFLSVTYQAEMISRVLFTFLFLYFLDLDTSILISFGIVLSFVFGVFPLKNVKTIFFQKGSLSQIQKKQITTFFALTALYEMTQIVINNSDILLVKHYFDSYEAGLYASLALIGRMVYFIAWMYVMILLPTVVKLKKEGKNTSKVLYKYVGYIGAISFSIVLVCFIFPKYIILLLFGDQYVGVGDLLWKYALATSLFAVSNIFAYYYLSLDRYFPVLFLAILGVSQVLLIVFFHKSLEQVVHVQIIAMFVLLVAQFLYYLKDQKNSIST
ncbi:oligosaccharide flippase family protein [Flavicella sp.]|uniref:oligosaccharide flippase family protein n=1 Tax=Flavicella sp. TaxID=2957742 RepID=UPI002638BC7C|nr:oligosaccharide flippase family protein [Flavicella sp.]MDG1805382.1 oligosaccharide flippase family protein [Flavicella sp.]MDG2280290.1 oligosaccharide flippase family protein [Flavicella sp.]